MRQEPSVRCRRRWAYERSVSRSDAAALLRAAAVVRDRRHVGDRRDADAQRTECTNRRLATGAGALDLDVQVLDALLHGRTASHFRRHLGSERRGLARALEALTTRRCPRQGVALAIGDRDDGVVEGSVHVRNTVGDVLADLLAHALGGVVRRLLSHGDLSISLLLQGLGGLARTLAGAGVGARTLAAHGQAAAMAEAAVAADVHQALDVHRRFATQVAFDRELGDLVADLFQIGVRQVLDLLRVVDAAGFADLARTGAATSEDRSQADLGVLVRRNVDTSNTCHNVLLNPAQPWRCL